MKRIFSPRTAPTNTADRLARTIPDQVARLSGRERLADRARIEAAGTSAWLYQRATGGRICTCGITDEVTALDDQGQLTPEAMNEIVRSEWNSDRQLESFRADDMEDDDIPDPTLPVEALPGDLGETNLTGDIDLLGQQEIRCAVCFGSGFVPGYRLSNGTRAVLVPEMISSTDFVTDVTDRPNVSRDGTYAEFEVTLPLRGLVWRVWDENAVPYPILPTIQPDPGSTGTIRFETTVSWTHFEMVTTGAAIPVDFPPMPAEDLSEAEYATTEFAIPAAFRVGLRAVVVESRTGNAWMVNQLTPVLDNQGGVVAQQVTARRIRGNELTRLLLGPFNTHTGVRAGGLPVQLEQQNVVVDSGSGSGGGGVNTDWLVDSWS